MLDDARPPFLQGWAIVENTTEHDWTEVNLSLVSGRPISFIMDLYQPLYLQRPVVEPELYASLRPQVYGGAMEQAGMAEAEKRDLAKDGGRRLESKKMLRPSAPAPAGGAAAADEPRSMMQEGITPIAAGQETGALFEYRLATPVSLPRQRSALFPILGQEIHGQNVSIYNQTVNAKHPLHGYRIKNSTPLYLMQGPMTVFEAGAYAGDARIEDVAPGQERLISYALDLKMEVESKVEGGAQELVTVAVKKGTLWVTRRVIEDRTVHIKNRDQKERSVLIEHPYRPDWKLLEPKEPAERTPDLYRFVVRVEAGQTGLLHVKESLPVLESVHLMDGGLNHIMLYLQAREVSQSVKEVLQKTVDLRNKLEDTKSRRMRQEQRIAEITAEHGRIRDNMQRLQQSSELYNRYVKKLDQQETELEGIRKAIESLKSTEEEQRRELQTYLIWLDVG